MKMPHIIFCALKDIPSHSEFTFDYDPCSGDYEKRTKKHKGKKRQGKKVYIPPGAIPCKCGEENCRKWVQVLS